MGQEGRSARLSRNLPEDLNHSFQRPEAKDRHQNRGGRVGTEEEGVKREENGKGSL